MIEEDFNSDQYLKIVADNVQALLDDSIFLRAPELDDQVCSVYILTQHTNYS